MGAWAYVAVVTTDSPHLMYAYIVLSLLVGVHTEEALGWCSQPTSAPPSTQGTSGRCSSGYAKRRASPTEVVYRRELRPVITTGAEIMDELFTAT